jgi:hypothetical protein
MPLSSTVGGVTLGSPFRTPKTYRYPINTAIQMRFEQTPYIFSGCDMNVSSSVFLSWVSNRRLRTYLLKSPLYTEYNLQLHVSRVNSEVS